MRRQGLFNGRCTNEPGLGWSWTLLGVIGGFGPAVVYLVYLVQRGGTCYSSAQRTSPSVSTASQLP